MVVIAGCYTQCMNLDAREGIKITGKVTIKTYRAGMVDIVKPLLETLKDLKNSELPGFSALSRRQEIETLKKKIEEVKEAYFIRTAVECPNLIMDSPNYGLDLIIQRLVGLNTYSGNILWIEIGTGSTTPTVNDTALTTPTVRLPISYQEDYATTDAIVQAYVTDANLANATYYEVGSFVDGTSSIGSGQIFNHALLSPTYTKVAGQDTTIQIDITVSNS
jgi:hypothetical protein